MKYLSAVIPMVLLISAAAFGGSLQGTVRDASTHAPIAGAGVTVHIHPDSVAMPTTTDQNGHYSITNIRSNNVIYDVVTLADGYVRLQTRVDNLGALDLVYDIFVSAGAEFPPAGGDSTSVFGTVMTPDSDSLLTIPGARIRISSSGQDFNTITNTNGKYSLRLPSNFYTISIEADGYRQVTVNGINAQLQSMMVDAILRTAVTGIANERPAPSVFTLYNAYPNPYNPSTVISYELAIPAHVRLKIYDVVGREIATLVDRLELPGRKSVKFDAGNLAGGAYYCRLDAGVQSETTKLMLVK